MFTINSYKHFTLVSAALILGLLLSPPAQAQNPFGGSPVFSGQSAAPAAVGSITISAPGHYVLARDIRVATGDGITITASGVTLDLNGRQITTDTTGNGRGVFINGATGVTVRNGRVGAFRTNVMVMNTVNARIEDLRITGANTGPVDGPNEIGVQLINSRGVLVKGNTITSVNLGLFVRGGNSTGNRITENTLVGGVNPAFNLLGICYNPAPGADAAVDGPSGDLIYNNHIARFGFGVAISAASRWNVFRDNTLASFMRGFREAETLTDNGGTNISEDNLEVRLPATVLQ